MNSMKGKRYWKKEYGIFVVEGIIWVVFIILPQKSLQKFSHTRYYSQQQFPYN